MKKNFFSLFTAILINCTAAEKKIPGGWTESGILPYSYAYARSYIGHKMRKDGWICKIGFTAGKKREQEHSVWYKGTEKCKL